MILHLLLLSVPLFVPVIIQPLGNIQPINWFLVCCFFASHSVAYLVDAVGAKHAHAESTRGLRTAALTGAVLLAINWLALVEWRFRTPALEEFGAYWIMPFVFGVLLLLCGASLRAAAFTQLGIQFRSELDCRENESLVESGVYRWLRHPSEAGLLAISFGGCLMLSSWLAIACWALVLVPLVLLRIKREDRFLFEAFGQTQKDYAKRVRRLIPGIY